MLRTLLTLLIAIISTVSCAQEQPQSLPVDATQLSVVSGDTVKAAFDVEIASTDGQRSTGLMHRRDLPGNRGMLFVFPDLAPRFFWMQNTPTALDIIYADDNGVIVSIATNTVPFSTAPIPSGAPAQYVLEVVAGTTTSQDIAVGDTLTHPVIGK